MKKALIILFALLLFSACGSSGGTKKCTISISCETVFEHLSDLPEGKAELLGDGVILPETEISFSEGDTAFDILKKACRDNKIHMEFSETPMYNSVYIEGINNLYEFDCGALSGWMYCVNGVFPQFGCSLYELRDGDKTEWKYTCDLGQDIGGGFEN